MGTRIVGEQGLLLYVSGQIHDKLQASPVRHKQNPGKMFYNIFLQTTN